MTCLQRSGKKCSFCYVCNQLRVFDELRRVLRDDGVIFWNIGDCFAGSIGSGGWGLERGNGTAMDNVEQVLEEKSAPWLKNKDQCLVPFHLSFALQEDGWWIRSTIVWRKGNAMVENVEDRPTDNYELIFLITKSEKYFYDYLACLEPLSNEDEFAELKEYGAIIGKNMRSVWDIKNTGSKTSHTASFPVEIPRRCILLGTPEKSCAQCGSPYRRIVEKKIPEALLIEHQNDDMFGSIDKKVPTPTTNRERYTAGILGEHANRGYPTGTPQPLIKVTKGFAPACKCLTTDTRRPIVLDPFGGTGTTAYVAEALGRDWITIELSSEYVKDIEERISGAPKL